MGRQRATRERRGVNTVFKKPSVVWTSLRPVYCAPRQNRPQENELAEKTRVIPPNRAESRAIRDRRRRARGAPAIWSPGHRNGRPHETGSDPPESAWSPARAEEDPSLGGRDAGMMPGDRRSHDNRQHQRPEAARWPSNASVLQRWCGIHRKGWLARLR